MLSSNRTGDNSGFTLAELLVTTALFAVFAMLTFVIVANVTKFWSEMRSRGDAYRRLDTVGAAITDDLRATNSDDLGTINGVSLTRFLSYIDDTGNHVLALTRAFSLGPERSAYILGTQGGKYYDYINGGSGKKDSDDLLPPDGLAEVAYFVKDGMLYRSLRAPATGTFQDIVAPNRARVVSAGVLRMSLRFWGPDTTEWEPSAGENLRTMNLLTLPLAVWDSTRGFGDKFTDFIYGVGTGSLAEPGDDVFPRMVEVSVVMDAGKARTALLRADTGTTDNVLKTSSTTGIPGPEIYPYLYIDGEWVEYSVKDSNGFVVQRGALGTKRAAHSAGAQVRWGYPAAFRVYVPGGKDAYDTGEGARR